MILILASIKLSFRFLSVEGLCPNIADNIKTPIMAKGHKKDCLTSDQIKSILLRYTEIMQKYFNLEREITHYCC
ncbi:MAG: hypothetical protein LBV62_00135 [Rickettsiales bacterium]|nr:hypothetical protein [Rickettsiales bacterium]